MRLKLVAIAVGPDFNFFSVYIEISDSDSARLSTWMLSHLPCPNMSHITQQDTASTLSGRQVPSGQLLNVKYLMQDMCKTLLTHVMKNFRYIQYLYTSEICCVISIIYEKFRHIFRHKQRLF